MPYYIKLNTRPGIKWESKTDRWRAVEMPIVAEDKDKAKKSFRFNNVFFFAILHYRDEREASDTGVRKNDWQAS